MEAEPVLARRVADEGHLVGNHSFYHARMPLLTDDGLPTDVREAETAIREPTGVDPRPWFRCPFSAGDDDPRVLAALAALGYRDVGADVVLEDWEPRRTGPAMAADALSRTPGVGDGAVVLFHAWPPGTLDALPAIVDGLRAAGRDVRPHRRAGAVRRVTGDRPRGRRRQLEDRRRAVGATARSLAAVRGPTTSHQAVGLAAGLDGLRGLVRGWRRLRPRRGQPVVAGLLSRRARPAGRRARG